MTIAQALAEVLPAAANIDAANLGIWGGGLGGALVWNAATGPLLGKLRAAAMQQATLNYDHVIRDHQFKDQLLVAYGIPPDADDDLASATLRFCCPLARTRLLAAEQGRAVGRLLPEAFFFHGDEDDHMWYEPNPVALKEAIDAAGGTATLWTCQGVGHSTVRLARFHLFLMCGRFSVVPLAHSTPWGSSVRDRSRSSSRGRSRRPGSESRAFVVLS